MTQINPWFPRF